MTKLTLTELRDAYAKGDVTRPVTLDNDSAHVYEQVGPDEVIGWECIFEMYPQEMLEQALDLLGIPHQSP